MTDGDGHRPSRRIAMSTDSDDDCGESAHDISPAALAASEALLLEMVVRTCRKLIRSLQRERMRERKVVSEDRMSSVVCGFFNLLTRSHHAAHESVIFWSEVLPREIAKRFGGVALSR